MGLQARSAARFSATQWSVIVEAKGSGSTAEQALGQLCQKYWYPIYAFLRRKPNTSAHDAEDLTQGFFAHLLAREFLANVTPQTGGKFRAFLLTCLDNYVRNEHRKQNARKRAPAGQLLISFDAQDAESRFRLEPAGGPEPAELYEIKWAETLMDNALRRLRDECAAEGKAGLFEALRPYLSCEAGRGDTADTARTLGMAEGAVRTATTRMRKRFAQILRAEVSDTVDAPHEIDEEIRHLLSLWSR